MQSHDYMLGYAAGYSKAEETKYISEIPGLLETWKTFWPAAFGMAYRDGVIALVRRRSVEWAGLLKEVEPGDAE